MPYKDPVFYNLEGAVGPGCRNNRTDVLLVQFFLREVCNHAHYRYLRPDGPNIAVDGLYGPQTGEWILTLQTRLKQKGRRIVPDGKVSVAPTSDYDFRFYQNARFYTICFLNGAFRKAYRLDHDYLDRSPRPPSELRACLGEFLTDV